ncbi:MAG: ABC-2 family transporter protein [Candidatus Limnocylindrales bacterium]
MGSLRGLLRALSLSWVFFRIGALNELQYRANLLIQIVQSLISLGAGLAVLAVVFGQTPDLNGWTQVELLALMGVHVVMGGIIGMSIQPNMERLMGDVRTGSFDFVLTKPDDAQTLASVREVRIWQAVEVLIGLGVLAFAVSQLPTGVGALEPLVFVVALLIGASMIYCFWLILTTFAFWVVQMDQIAELFDGVYQSGRWPVTIYPGWLKISLTYLVPVAFAVTVPAEALTGRLTGETLATAAVFALILLAFTRWFWRFGLKHYSGASA